MAHLDVATPSTLKAPLFCGCITFYYINNNNHWIFRQVRPYSMADAPNEGSGKDDSAMLTILEPVGGELRVLLSGEIDHHSAAEMRLIIDEAVERHGPQRLVLDFGGVSFMDSSGIGLVMGRYKLMRTINGVVEVANTPRVLRKVMRLAGLDRLAEIDNSDNGGIEHEAR